MITDKRKEIATEFKSKQKSQIFIQSNLGLKKKKNSSRLSLLTKHLSPADTESHLKTRFSYEQQTSVNGFKLAA